MEGFYKLLGFGLLLFFCACDLERIDTENASKFITAIGGTGTDYPSDVYPNPDGTLTIIGRSNSFTSNMDSDVYLARMDKTGVLLWENHFGSDKYESGIALTPAVDGGIILCGIAGDGANVNNLFLLKVNSNGVAVWEKTYTSVDSTKVPFGIIPIGVDYLVGYTTHPNTGSGSSSIRFMKINANGSKVSDKLGVTGYNGSINQMIKTAKNEIVIVGTEFTSFSTSYIAKFTEDATMIWHDNFSGVIENYTPGRGVVELADNSLMVAGSYLGDNDHDFNIVSYSDIGMRLIDNQWGGANADELLSITNTQDGEFVVLGYTGSFSTMSEIYLSKRRKSDGSEIWIKHFDNNTDQDATVRLCPDGGFIICKGQNQFNADIIVIKTDANGDYQ